MPPPPKNKASLKARTRRAKAFMKKRAKTLRGRKAIPARKITGATSNIQYMTSARIQQQTAFFKERSKQFASEARIEARREGSQSMIDVLLKNKVALLQQTTAAWQRKEGLAAQLKSALGNLRNAVSSTVKEGARATVEAVNAATRMKDMATAKNTANMSAALHEQYLDYIRMNQELQDALSKGQEARMKELQKQLERITQATNKMGNELESNIKSEFNKLNDKLKDVANKLDNLSKGLDKVADSLSEMGKKIQEFNLILKDMPPAILKKIGIVDGNYRIMYFCCACTGLRGIQKDGSKYGDCNADWPYQEGFYKLTLRFLIRDVTFFEEWLTKTEPYKSQGWYLLHGNQLPGDKKIMVGYPDPSWENDLHITCVNVKAEQKIDTQKYKDPIEDSKFYDSFKLMCSTKDLGGIDISELERWKVYNKLGYELTEQFIIALAENIKTKLEALIK